MHCNQPIFGNGFHNGQYYGYNTPDPLPQNNYLTPQVVGEGEVTSVALPDGTFQFFFIPTNKWWAPYSANNYPLCTKMYNTNSPTSWSGPSLGAWFVRSITNPVYRSPPYPVPILPWPAYDVPAQPNYSNCILNTDNTGFQLKFHNDKCTSTTDLHHFIPCLRLHDCTISLPAKGCAGVQVDTPMSNNTTCHYQVLCSKPCNCTSKPCEVDVVLSKSGSAMSLADTNIKIEHEVCICRLPPEEKVQENKCPMPSKDANNKWQDVCEYCLPPKSAKHELKLLPSDPHNKRIKIKHKKVKKTTSDDVVCECCCPPAEDKCTSTYTDTGC